MLQDIRAFALPLSSGQRALDVAIIVPTFNEAENIAPLIARLSAALTEFQWEVIFVDDNSPDHSAEVVRSFACTHPHIRIVQRVGRRGRRRAVEALPLRHRQGQLAGQESTQRQAPARLFISVALALRAANAKHLGPHRRPDGSGDAP